jgi:hypothetical protein
VQIEPAPTARRAEDFVATFVTTFVVPIPNRDFEKVGDEGCDKGPESELLRQALDREWVVLQEQTEGTEKAHRFA